MAKNVLLATGWIVAAVLGGVLYVEFQTIHALNEKLVAARETYENVKDSVARVVSLEEKCAALEATVEKLKAASEKGMETAAALRDKIEVPEGFDPKALLKNMFHGSEADGEKTDGGADGKDASPFAAMFKGEQGEKMMEAMIPTQVDMQYGALLSELGLNAERRAALRDVLIEHARKGAAAALAVMRGEKNMGEIEGPAEEDLLAAVRAVLDPEEFEQFSQYQEELPARMMRQSFDMQMGMMAGDLPEEVRAHTVDVLVENMLAAQPDQHAGVPDFEAMGVAFDNTIATLEQENLAPEHLDRVRAFIQQQRAGIDVAASMFGKGDGEEPAAPSNPDAAP